MRIPIVKEYGSWAVFVLSCLAALTAGLLTHPWESEREFFNETVLTILGMAFLINSKNPFASLLRAKSDSSSSEGRKKEHLLWFLFFSMVGLAFLTPFLIDGLKQFSVFFLLIIIYVLLLSAGKEHHLMAELNGFALLTLSAPIVYFVITDGMSMKLYAAVLIFFCSRGF